MQNTVVCHQSSCRHLMRIRTVRLRKPHVLQSARHCPRTCRPPPRLPPPLWARSSHFPPHSLSTAASLLTSSARRTSRRAISSSASFSAGWSCGNKALVMSSVFININILMVSGRRSLSALTTGTVNGFQCSVYTCLATLNIT